MCGPSFLGLFLWEVPTTEHFWTAQNECWDGLLSTIFQNHQPIRRTSAAVLQTQQSASVCNSNFNDGKFPMENWKISPNLGSILSCRERESEKERLLIISAHLVVGIDIKAEAVVNLLPCYKSSGSKMEIQRLKVLIEGPVLAVTAVKGN